jgi:plasmid stabilization system protein ParE
LTEKKRNSLIDWHHLEGKERAEEILDNIIRACRMVREMNGPPSYVGNKRALIEASKHVGLSYDKAWFDEIGREK